MIRRPPRTPLRFTLRRLEYFVAVGEAGGIALATEKVNVSAPSMSSATAQLESGFGVHLFTRRHAQGSTLTPPGQRLFEQAKIVLAEADRPNALANIVSESVRGSPRVGCLSTFAMSCRRSCAAASMTSIRRSISASSNWIRRRSSAGCARRASTLR